MRYRLTQKFLKAPVFHNSIWSCYKVFFSLAFPETINILEPPLPTPSVNLLSHHLPLRETPRETWAGTSPAKCDPAARNVKKCSAGARRGCQSSQPWSCLFTVIIIMSRKERADYRWRGDVRKLHVTPSCEAGIETETANVFIRLPV